MNRFSFDLLRYHTIFFICFFPQCMQPNPSFNLTNPDNLSNQNLNHIFFCDSSLTQFQLKVEKKEGLD